MKTLDGDEAGPRRATSRTDARSLRSKARLREALLHLIEDRPYDGISLREIAAEAGVSYPTLFNHYDGKNALFHDLARAEIGALLAAFRARRTSSDWRPGADICALILERRSLWRTLLTTGAADAMRAEFIRLGRSFISATTKLGHNFPFDVVSGLIASGMFEIIAWWLGQPAEHDTAEIADMLERLVLEPALGLPSGYFAARSHPDNAA